MTMITFAPESTADERGATAGAAGAAGGAGAADFAGSTVLAGSRGAAAPVGVASLPSAAGSIVAGASGSIVTGFSVTGFSPSDFVSAVGCTGAEAGLEGCEAVDVCEVVVELAGVSVAGAVGTGFAAAAVEAVEVASVEVEAGAAASRVVCAESAGAFCASAGAAIPSPAMRLAVNVASAMLERRLYPRPSQASTIAATSPPIEASTLFLTYTSAPRQVFVSPQGLTFR